METTLYQITFRDGREFRVFCANRKQKERILKTWDLIKDKCDRDGIKIITNGIHDIAQWEKILASDNK